VRHKARDTNRVRAIEDELGYLSLAFKRYLAYLKGYTHFAGVIIIIRKHDIH